ncbi:MAG: tRNA (adenosine(37)-N6)-threonylcarbamoyltransferase complex ATPase subunit type 1 TsaE [Simkaniaceae bacterium]|jgi:tRNA threonylcarbamoyladenosine biosynthesis protein TsaE|nr:MAG: tRNA (adenosine(37)-N6)-threonylcarbamoyltransferase complex ATPase subunit type 1 TsaE [Simkaniaceae bacterium]
MSSKLTSSAGSKKINSFLSSSAEETEAIGRKIAQDLQAGSIVCLMGDLGAGKTTLSKGIISEITGIAPHQVNSPTFTYLNIYEGKNDLFHFDCYRLKGSDDFLERGFDEYFGQLCLIEWPEKIEAVLPSERIHITIEYNGENKRIITYEETRV